MEQQQDLEEWFDEYGQAIVTYILLIVRDYPLAEDLTQETFLKAYIKTNWSEKPNETVINEITEAVETYLELPETKSQRRDDIYTIQFLNIDGEVFINISNK